MKPIIFALCCILIFPGNKMYGQSLVLDSTFGTEGEVITTNGNLSGYGHSVAIQQDGKIVVAGFTEDNGNNSWFAVYRYNQDGALDNSFGANGIVTTAFEFFDEGLSVVIQSDGKIIVGGYSGSGDKFVLSRYQNNGTLDSTFGNFGKDELALSGGTATTIAIQTGGKILIGGWSYSYNPHYSVFALERCNTDGTADSSFGLNGIVVTDFGGEGAIQSIAIQPDRKIIAAGWVDSFQTYFAVARYDTSGQLDTSFANGGKTKTLVGTGGTGQSVALQPDGKIIVAGGDESAFKLTRYGANGDVDLTFGIDGQVITAFGGPNGAITMCNAVLLQSNGQIIAAGSAINSGGYGQGFGIVRYNSDGSVDDAITTDFGGYDFGESAVLQPDGKIVVAGYTTNSGNNFAVARYLSDLPLGIIDVPGWQPVFIYPNPVEEQAVLKYSLNKDEVVTACLYDINGALIKNFFGNQFKTKGNHTETLLMPLFALAAGNYFIVISAGQQKSFIKIDKL